MASIISAGTSTGTALNMTGDTSGALALATNNGTTAVTITTAQYVGIGTASPTALLHVYGTTAPAIQIGKSGDLGAGFQLGRDSATLNAFIIQRENADLFIRTNNAERMRITAAGDVGIGTSSPGQKLHVSSTTNRAYGLIQSTATTAGPEAGIQLMTANRNFYLFTDYDSQSFNVYDATANAFRMRVDSSGSFYVGKTVNDLSTPGFHVNMASAGNFNGIAFIKNSGPWGTATYIARTSAAGNGALIEFAYNGSTIGSITSNTSTTAYNTSSDYRLKENIAAMTGALSTVEQLKPVTYTWKVDGSDGQGFIAHELAEVVPECVTGEKDAVDVDGNPVYQGIDTSFLVATLTAAIQELKVIVDAQAVEIAALKTQVGA